MISEPIEPAAPVTNIDFPLYKRLFFLLSIFITPLLNKSAILISFKFEILGIPFIQDSTAGNFST